MPPGDGPFAICGLDEAGRGAWAGPLVAAAVILGPNFRSSTRIRDSKLLSSAQRQQIFRDLQKQHISFQTEVVSVRMINRRGIGWANKEIFRRLIRKLNAAEFVVDGNLKIRVRGKSHQIRSVVDADATITAVILAGIVAKVTRDRQMLKLHSKAPEFDWQKNKGYGTTFHQAAVRKFGITTYHRTLFVRTALAKINAPIVPPRQPAS